MKTEKQKSLLGELYDAYDPQLIEDRRQTRLLLKKFNDTGPDETGLRTEILQKLFRS